MLSRIFKAFQYRDFRLLWFGACTSSIGTWMQKLAQSWVVLQLSNSPFLLGLDAFLGELPILLFSLIGGVAADRRDRRHLLVASQVVQMSCAFLLMMLFVFKVVKVWQILCLSFVTGLAQAFGGPAYQALIPSIVSIENVSNAIALNSIQFNLARVIGPVLGGIALAKLGPAWCFGLNGLSFCAVIVSLLIIRTPFIKGPYESVIDSMKQGLRFVRMHAVLPALVVLAFLMTGARRPAGGLSAGVCTRRLPQRRELLYCAARHLRSRFDCRCTDGGRYGEREGQGAHCPGVSRRAGRHHGNVLVHTVARARLRMSLSWQAPRSWGYSRWSAPWCRRPRVTRCEAA